MAHAAIAFAKAIAPPADDGLHHLDRPRRHQHGDRRRASPTSTGCRCCCCPATSSPAAGPTRCCSRSRISPTARSRRTTASGRCRAISTASRGPSRSSPRCRARMQRADRSGRMRPGDAGAVPGRAGRGLRLSGELLRRARLDAAPHPRPDERELADAAALLAAREEAADRRRRRRALFARPSETLGDFAADARHSGRRDAGRQERRCRTTIRSTWARSASPARAPPTRSRAEADVVLAVGTRLQDFTTGSWALFQNPDAAHHRPQRADASMPASTARCRWSATPRVGARASWPRRSAAGARRAAWTRARREPRRRAGASSPPQRPAPTNAELPSDAQVIGAVQRAARAVRRRRLRRRRPAGRAAQAVAGAARPAATTCEYGYSCMGYEIAGGLGVKMARPDARGDRAWSATASYLMMNSEIATSVMLGLKLTIVVLDNRGFGCINRLQRATGGESFNNLLAARPARDAARRSISPPMPQASARQPRRSTGIAELEAALAARPRGRRAPPSSSSTPIRSPRPRPAATGGTSRCRRCPSAPRCEARARAYESALTRSAGD